MGSTVAAAALVVALSTTATAQVAILQIQVVEGEGGVHAPGSRSPRLLTVEVTDESGRRVPRAAVSFHLPEEGPSGVFANGLRTDVVTADEQGRASLRGLRWNRVAGRLQIRIIASKEQARAGIVSFQYIRETGDAVTARSGGSETETATASRTTRGESESKPKLTRGHRRWIAVLALVGGGAAAGLLATRSGGAGAAGPQAAALVSTPVTIGTPTVTVGKP